MSGIDTATLRDLAPLARPTRFPLRRSRLAPGPLKPLARQRRRPGAAVWGGIIGLSLAVSLLVAPHLHGAPTRAPEPASLAETSREALEPARVVGSTEAVPAPAPVEDAIRSEVSSPAPPTAVPMPEPVAEPVRQTAAPSPVLGPLPVLELDATAFDAMQAPAREEAPVPLPRAARRP